MSALLEVEGLAAGYAGFCVIEDLWLQARSGQLTVLVGPNGAGKTTLLKAICGVIPSRGEVRFDGVPVRGAGVSQRVALGLSLVPEGRHLFGQMSVRENLELGAYLLPRRERQGQMRRVLECFPRLAERQDQLAGTMSGGEQQMVAIGRAMMSRPRLLMLDEPSLGLAPKMVAELFRVVKCICEEGTSVLLVEQNVRQALAIADYSYVLERGRIVAQGTGEQMLNSDLIQRAYLGTL